MTAETCRDYLAEPVRDQLPKWIVDASPAEPGQVRRNQPFLAIWRADLVPGETPFRIRHEMELNLYGAKDATEAAELELEGYLDALLVILQSLDRFTFTRAERTVFKGSFQGWKITGYIETDNIYRSAVLAERRT